jgi:hypothetical protein
LPKILIAIEQIYSEVLTDHGASENQVRGCLNPVVAFWTYFKDSKVDL